MINPSINYVTKTPEGGWRVAGSRVSLDSIVHAFHHGRMPESIVADFPSLSLEQVYGAIAYYLQERFDESLIDCHHAVRLMPSHFGAWAGLGHCYAHLNQPREAIKAYEKALAINPHLDCIKQAVSELRKQVL